MNNDSTYHSKEKLYVTRAEAMLHLEGHIRDGYAAKDVEYLTKLLCRTERRSLISAFSLAQPEAENRETAANVADI